MTPRRASAWPSCSARPSAGRRRPRACSWARVERARARASPARRRSRSRCPAPTTSRSPPRSTSTPSATATVPLSFHFNGNVFYRGDDGRLQVVPVPVELHRQLPDAGRDLARDDRRALSRAAAGSGSQRRHARRAQRAPRPRAGCRASTRCVAELFETRRGRWMRAARDARRLAALRGVRALPVHAGCDQERDPDAVRIVYPPAYAAECDGRVRPCPAGCVADAEPGARLTADAALPGSPSGDRATRRRERRLQTRPGGRRPSASARSSMAVGFTLRSQSLDDGGALVRALRPQHGRGRAGPRPRRRRCARPDLDARRGRDLRRSASSRRSKRGRESVNIWPVLASPTTTRCSVPRSSFPTTRRCRAREPRQPVRRHGDRGGAGPARARADRRRARADRRARTRPSGDDRARALAVDSGADRRPARRPWRAVDAAVRRRASRRR